MPAILSREQVARLRNTVQPDLISKLLFSFSGFRLQTPAVIKQYHDLLLFYCAFPYDLKIYQLAREELKRIAFAIKKITQTNSKKQMALMASGIAHTELFCSYSQSIAQWLHHKFPSDVEYDSSGASMETVRNTLQLLLPPVEFEKATQGEFELGKRLQLLSAKKDKSGLLNWLLKAFDESKLPLAVKEELYRQLKIFICWKLKDENFSRTFLRLPIEKIYYQKDFIKYPDSANIIKQGVLKPINLSKAEKSILTDTIKASLSLQLRETDPISFADINELDLFDIGRGMQIALVGMTKNKRLSLESYIGFMAFKNGLPVSYGGGWLWGHRCKIGINIFAPFRKGESAWLFYQVLRLYYQLLGARHFVVNPYQFGKGNPDGLKSGAFWFYYKAGFRPQDEVVRKIADKEWNKIQQDKSYRTPINLLRQFTCCYAEWITDKSLSLNIPATHISASISSMIVHQFHGSRKKALEISNQFFLNHFAFAVQKNKILFQQEVLDNWSLLIYLLKDCNNWSNKEKTGLIRIILLKQEGKERDYILQLQKFKKFWRIINGLDQ